MKKQSEGQEKVVLVTVEGKEDLFSVNLKKYPILEKVTFYDRVALRAKIDDVNAIGALDNLDEHPTGESVVLLEGIYKVIDTYQSAEDKFLPYLIKTKALSPLLFENSVKRIHVIREFALHADLEAMEAEVLFCKFTM